MIHILNVEDNPSARDQLSKYIRESFTESYVDAERKASRRRITVDEAGTVVEARKKIDDANREGFPFNAVVLDYKLPHDQGENPEGDLTLCEYLTSVNADVFIMHVSGFEDDATLLQHICEKHTQTGQAAGNFVGKSEGYPEKVVKILKSQIYGMLILSQLGLGGYGASPYMRADGARTAGSGRQSLTHALSSLTRDVKEYWEFLEPEVRNRVRKVLLVDLDDSPDSIGRD